MAKAEQTKAWSGGVAWMIALALGTIPQTWPNILRPHPYFVGFFILCGAILFAYGSVHKNGTQQRAGKGNIAGGDVTGRQIIATNYHEHIAQSAGPAVPDETQKKKIAHPKLVVSEVEFRKDTSNQISGSNEREPFILLPIENRVGDTAPAKSVCASIDYLSADGSRHYVQKAFWFKQLGYNIGIPISNVEYVVIGQYENQKLYYFTNFQEFTPQWNSHSIFDDYDDDNQPRRHFISLRDGDIKATVTLFNPYTGDVYVTCRLNFEDKQGMGAKAVRLP